MESNFQYIASLIGDPTRSVIMWTLLDGRALTATELAIAAETSPQNISMHLNKLVTASLLKVESQGRHRYYTYSRKEIAYAIEAMANLVPFPEKTAGVADNHSAIKYCRTCYDHLAGRVGVLITESLLKQKIVIDNGSAFTLSKKGEQWLSTFDIKVDDLKNLRRSFIRPCLDWSERKPHIAGSVAAVLLNTMLQQDWMRRIKKSRALLITAKGQKKLHEYFNITV